MSKLPLFGKPREIRPKDLAGFFPGIIPSRRDEAGEAYTVPHGSNVSKSPEGALPERYRNKLVQELASFVVMGTCLYKAFTKTAETIQGPGPKVQVGDLEFRVVDDGLRPDPIMQLDYEGISIGLVAGSRMSGASFAELRLDRVHPKVTALTVSGTEAPYNVTPHILALNVRRGHTGGSVDRLDTLLAAYGQASALLGSVAASGGIEL